MRGYACEHERIELLSSGMWNVYLKIQESYYTRPYFGC